jgi:hypothetical protein
VSESYSQLQMLLAGYVLGALLRANGEGLDVTATPVVVDNALVGEIVVTGNRSGERVRIVVEAIE